METGESVVRVSVWIALSCYPAGPWGPLLAGLRARRLARAAWTGGCAAFLVHVLSSFDVFYGWSHRIALDETRKQVERATGVVSGSGLYLNYLFAVLWIVDVAWWWFDPESYRTRARHGLLLLHGFFLFMIFNATVVFADGPVRGFGLLVTVAGAAALVETFRRRGPAA